MPLWLIFPVYPSWELAWWDEGDDGPYTLQANVLDIPATVPVGPATNPIYFNEVSERNDDDWGISPAYYFKITLIGFIPLSAQISRK